MAVAGATIQEGFRYVEQPPFGLCRGDIQSRFVAFSKLPEPVDETSRNKWLLLRMGYSRQHLEAGLQRLREMKHSSITIEQARKAGSVFMQMHRMYSDATMRAWSFTYQLKPLFNTDPLRQRW